MLCNKFLSTRSRARTLTQFLFLQTFSLSKSLIPRRTLTCFGVVRREWICEWQTDVVERAELSAFNINMEEKNADKSGRVLNVVK